MKIFQKIKHSITKKIFLLIVLSIGASFAVSLLVIKNWKMPMLIMFMKQRGIY